MPQNVHLIELYQDPLLDLFTRRIEHSDEYLDEVLPSGWAIAPDTPDQFKKLLSDTPFTREYDDDGGSDAELREEVSDWSDGKLEVAKAIQSEFGVDNESFTYSDVADLKSSFKKNSIRPWFTKTFEEEGYAARTGEKDGQSVLWRWVKSIYAKDAIADGGIKHDFRAYNWELAQNLDPETVIDETRNQSLNNRDWFATHNLVEYLKIYTYAEELHQRILALERKKRDIEDGFNLDEWDIEEIRDALDFMKKRFQDIFSILTDFVTTSLDNVSACAGSNLSQSNQKQLHEEYKPHKKKKIQHRRLEAKRWAILKTFIKPLLNYYPVDVAIDPEKQEQLSAHLEDFEEVVHAFLRWLWVSYQDLDDHAAHGSASIHDVVIRILRRRKGNSGAIGFNRLRELVSREFNFEPTEDDLFDVLIELCADEKDYSIKVWENGDEPENLRPREAPAVADLEVEIYYDKTYDPTWIDFLKSNAHDIEV